MAARGHRWKWRQGVADWRALHEHASGVLVDHQAELDCDGAASVPAANQPARVYPYAGEDECEVLDAVEVPDDEWSDDDDDDIPLSLLFLPLS